MKQLHALKHRGTFRRGRVHEWISWHLVGYLHERIFAGKKTIQIANANIPTRSMYGIFTYIHHKIQLKVGKYTIHGSSGIF